MAARYLASAAWIVKRFVNPFAAALDAVQRGSTSPMACASFAAKGETAEIFSHMQRVRIGLTGLAAVFLLVVLGAIFTQASNEEPITANLIEQQMAPGNQAAEKAAEEEPKEPLAELGVAPGNAEDNMAEGADAAR